MTTIAESQSLLLQLLDPFDLRTPKLTFGRESAGRTRQNVDLGDAYAVGRMRIVLVCASGVGSAFCAIAARRDFFHS
jgi:hypothetical protein